MNILIISQYFWPENFRINDLAEYWVKNGHNVSVLTAIPNYPEGRFYKGYGILTKTKENYKGVKILRVPIISRGTKNNLRLILNYFSFVFSSLLLAPFYCHEKYDLIFIFEVSPITVALPAILLKKIKKIPIFLWVLDLWPESLSATNTVKSPFVLSWVGKLVRYIYKQCDCIMAASEAYFPSIEDLGGEKNKLSFFPNWGESVYESPPQNNSLPEKIKLPHGFKIMFAGNIGVSQDFETILSAAELTKEYPEIHWIIIGEGRRSDWVKEQIQLRNLNHVHVLGRFPQETMPAFFAQADVMLVTLKKDKIFSLTIPGKIQSYLACGKPVIASLDGAGNELVKKAQAGFTCEAENPEELAKQVIAMYRTSPAERESMGLHGKKYYEANFKRSLLFNRLQTWMQNTLHPAS